MNKLMRLHWLWVLAFPFSASLAQEGARPALKLVVPYSAGGSTDYVARLLQKPLSEILNQPVIIENKPGAAGTIGTDFVAKATPDGNTLVFGNQGPNAIVPAARPTPYDPINDLRPLTTVAFMPLVLMTSADLGPKTLKEFLQRGRSPGTTMNYGSSGTGSLAHLTGHEFSRQGKLDMTHVPYQGGGAVTTALLRGEIQGSFATGLESAALMQSGKLRFLAVTSAKRLPTLADVPTLAEEIPGFESTLWFAVFAPKGTRDDVAERLRNAVVKAVERPEFQKYLAARHAEARTSTPQELTQLVKQDMARWGDVVRKAKIPM
ncbi:tripartite tricarboxylate transporter substrate binding protein [Polaromonas hydrogenivorans]|uniref:Tripartite tricarboxylate transporter substrate binding protein n=1 Tax=Polaromonas hydrogenivorans TaxID=335476 RepID=A0AAU7LYD2_9BURK